MTYIRLLLIVFTIIFSVVWVKSQDVEPPVVVVLPQSIELECGEHPNLQTQLLDWYNNAAGAVFMDNSGAYIIQTNLTLSEMLTTFQNSSAIRCGNTQQVTVVFTAIDSSGNVSLPYSASFTTVDTKIPSINSIPNVTYDCIEGISDTLINWIKNKGGYIASDACSNTVMWTDFVYNITDLNTGIRISNGTGSIANGPYPSVPNGICNWGMSINFFVRDECNNLRITPASLYNFKVEDKTPPVILNFEPFITVSCDKIPSPDYITIDYCDQSPNIIFSEINNKSPFDTLCAHYSYSITRKWLVSDNCGNTNEYEQTIIVQDTTKPVLTGNLDVTLTCDTFFRDGQNLYVEASDNCGLSSVTFVDDFVVKNCTSIVERTYTAVDFCGNSEEFIQYLTIVNNKPPTVLLSPIDQKLSCTSEEDILLLLSNWLSEMGFSRATTQCSSLSSFAALKGTYNIEDPRTFPGTLPTNLPSTLCPSPLDGYLRYLEVDFVYYDTCGNYIVLPAVFGVVDTIAPSFGIDCNKQLDYDITGDDCFLNISIPIPTAIDDCINNFSSVSKITKVDLPPSVVGQPNDVFDAFTMRIGPLNTLIAQPLEDGSIEVRLLNMDINDPTEYFTIYGEDDQPIGVTTTGTPQCSNDTVIFFIAKNKLTEWAQDGYLDLYFVPNIIPGLEVLAINNFCGQSSVEVVLSYEVDTRNTVKYNYRLDDNNPVLIGENEVNLSLSVGDHKLVFTAFDCSGNSEVCTYTIKITDNNPPKIFCPDNFAQILSSEVCSDTVLINLDIPVEENCVGNLIYDKTFPPSNEQFFISYILNPQTDEREARSFQMIFENTFPIKYVDKDVVLEIDFFGDNNEVGEHFDIFSPSGILLGRTSLGEEVGCGLSKSTIFIPVDDFNKMIANEKIIFSLIPSNLGTNRINPCQPVVGSNAIDNISFVQGRLKYSDMQLRGKVQGATNIKEFDIASGNDFLELVLNSGVNEISLIAYDANGNSNTCTFLIDMIDEEAPKAVCKVGIVTVDPSGILTTELLPEMVDGGSTDNCALKTLEISPKQIDCSQVNMDISVVLTVTDIQGNSSSCNSLIRSKPYELNPTFSSDLCSKDTLKLYANIPPPPVEGIYSYHWEGPNNIRLFTENPVITNIDENYNGVYTLTIVGFNNCISVGSVIVNIQPTTIPALTANENIICEGQELILRTTLFNGNVDYVWYDGIFPTGVPIRTTKVPEFVFTPASVGPHFYYVIAYTNECQSSPSQLLKITVENRPNAQVRNTLLTPCSGDMIRLEAILENPEYTYRWTGPNGYVGQGINPIIVQNAQLINSGFYYLIVDNKGCLSDTATTRVEIFERPLSPIISGQDILCEGDIFSLVATRTTDGDKYDWFKDGVLFTVTLENDLTLSSAQTALQGLWTVHVHKGQCISELSTGKFIAIEPALQIGVINSGPICEGDSIKLQATFIPNATYSWTGPVNNIPPVYNPTVAGVPGDYRVELSTPSGCKSNGSTIVNVIQVPLITAISSNVMPCMNIMDTITFFPSVFPANDTYAFKWTGPQSFLSSIKNPKLSNLDDTKVGTYTLEVINQGCSSAPVDVAISYDLKPEKPNIIGTNVACQNSNLSLTTSGVSSSFEWNTPASGAIVTNGPELNINNLSTIHQGIYQLVLVNGECKSEPSDTFELKIVPLPETPEIIGQNDYCHGETITLSPRQVDKQGVYRWRLPSNALVEVDTFMLLNSSKIHSGVYTLFLEKEGCTSNASSPFIISVKDSIKVPQFTINQFSLCSSNSTGVEICLMPSSLQENGLTTIMSSNGTTIVQNGTQSCYAIADLTLFEEGINQLQSITTFQGCQSKLSDPLIIDVSNPPNLVAKALENNIIICDETFLRLVSIDGPPLVTPKWIPVSPNLTISDINGISPIVSNFAEGNNVLLLTYSTTHCVDFSMDTIMIYKEFLPSLLNDFFTVEIGSSQYLDVSQNDVFPQNATLKLITQPKNGSAAIDNNGVLYTSNFDYSVNDQFEYELCAEYCPTLCDNASVFITINGDVECKFPTIITPNNDGYNDYFIISCLYSDKYKNSHLIVYNEWGTKVYEAAPYKNDWNGTYNEQELPVGTYFFTFELGDGSLINKGFIIIQR